MPPLRTLMPLAALAGSAAAFFGFVHRPALAEQRALRQEIEVATAAWGDVPAQVAALEAIGDEIAARESFLGRYSDRLPQSQAVQGFVHRVGMRAEAHGIDNLRIRPGVSTAGATYQTHPFSLTFEAAGGDAIAFLGELERKPNYGEITRLAMQTNTRGSAAGRLTVSVDLRIVSADKAKWATDGGSGGNDGPAGFDASPPPAPVDPA